jgi:hypothetical protein
MNRAVLRLALLACTATLALYARSLLWPVLSQDDFGILAQSLTWERTTANLWLPQNEHVMPLGRLLTFVLVQMAGSAPNLPRVVDLLGPVALLLGMILVYVLVRRECGHPLYGLVALTLFGVTTVYQQAVFWFSSSFSVLVLDTLLLALLAAQRWRETGRALYLDLAVACCALAPAWFASGILAGPLCCLYLLGGSKSGSRRCFTFLPLLGTGLFLAVSLPRTAAAILHLEHYRGKTALEAFDPVAGLVATARSVVDNLLIGMAGVSLGEVAVPLPLDLLGFGLLVAVGLWWWRQAPAPRNLMLLGLGLIGGSYWLTYSARAAWGYAGVMTHPAWSRYHLLPQLGLALFVCGGLPGRASPLRSSGSAKESRAALSTTRWFTLDETERLTPKQVRALQILIAACFLVQLPRGLLVYFSHPGQADSLRAIAAMEERCREHHVRGDEARAVLPKLDLGGSATEMNGWELLRGSDDPRPHTASELKQLLQP